MSQMSKVAKAIRQNKKSSGITAAQIARRAGMTKESVHKRVYDLRTIFGLNITSDYRIVNGKRKVYYTFAA